MGYSVASTKKVITILYTSNITLTHTHKNSKVRVKNNTTPPFQRDLKDFPEETSSGVAKGR